MSSVPPKIDSTVINALRRRPPGERVLVYLDHSTLSGMARGESQPFIELRRLLEDSVESGRLVCPRSLAHHAESVLAKPNTFEAIDELSHTLAMGIEFLDCDQIELNEFYAAARAFLGESARELWTEAFGRDPHTPRKSLFFKFQGGQIRVLFRLAVDECHREEVLHEKAKEEPMAAAYEELHKSEHSFEVIAEANFDAMLDWKLPVFNAERFHEDLRRRHDELVHQWLTAKGPDMAPGSALNRYLRFATRDRQTNAFLEHFPDLRGRLAEFKTSVELRSMPTLRFPALLRAALATDPTQRKAREGDGYDIAHLTIGLSRCDIVTADKAMTRIVRERGLVPDSCQLFEFRDVAGCTAAIANALNI